MWNLIISLVVGLVSGLIAKALMSGDRGEPSGWFVTMLLGLVGGVIGGILFGMIGIHAWGPIGRVIVSTVGAIVVIAVVRKLQRL